MTDPTKTPGFLALEKACSNGSFANMLEAEALRLIVTDDWDETLTEELQADMPVTQEDVLNFLNELGKGFSQQCATAEGARDLDTFALEAFESDLEFFMDLCQEALPLLHAAVSEILKEQQD